MRPHAIRESIFGISLASTLTEERQRKENGLLNLNDVAPHPDRLERRLRHLNAGRERKVLIHQFAVRKETLMEERYDAGQGTENGAPESPAIRARSESSNRREGKRDPQESTPRAHDESNERCLLSPTFFDSE